jgi:hypothetical protein
VRGGGEEGWGRGIEGRNDPMYTHVNKLIIIIFFKSKY